MTADEINRVLGCVLTYSDENFNPALAMLRLRLARSAKEWAWRVKRGEAWRTCARSRGSLGRRAG